MKLGNEVICTQRQLLCQSQVQSLQILAMNNQGLKDCLSAEYLENPMLDYTPSKTDETRTDIDALYEKNAPAQDPFSPWMEEDGERKNDIPARPACLLKQEVLMQLHRERYTEEQWRLMDFLCECLDEEGFFPMKAGEATRCFGCVEQRENTILQIIRAIVVLQRSFFQRKGELRPMALNDIAGKIGMHPSTVSRAIKGKYLQYPCGTVLVKILFSAPALDCGGDVAYDLACGLGRDVSAKQIRSVLRELIREENPESPLSDLALVQELRGRNIMISRRTVAKYRAEMGIMNSDQRRYLSGRTECGRGRLSYSGSEGKSGQRNAEKKE